MSEKEETISEKYSKLRIRARNQHEWVIEGFQRPGIVSRGPHAGKPKTVKWDETNPIGYFTHLKHAANRLLLEECRNLWPSEGWTGEDLTELFTEAENRVYAAVKEALQE